ncbi:preprotein translocase subunit SecF [Aeromonas sp. RU39B]|uniref:protein translocase subunit SecF n=1 Tax=Aeromonas sp. RU39B TaxID=1907416 RepID=UPI0009573994|nr:protein translocase subunit SecF [Aeromonas sp. RU39B]SIQ19760.1 preprotein translocase subunit SecF [Aeromonas sp. RU39B]
MTHHFHGSLTRARYVGLGLSLLLTLACLVLLATRGLQLGLDFTGGSLLEFRIDTLRPAHELNAMLSASLRSVVELHPAGALGEWFIKLPEHALAWTPQELTSRLSDELAMSVELLRTTQVGPQVGAELLEQGMLALLAASIAISVYLAFRFEWRQAVGVLVSVLHDALVALGLLALLQVEFDLNIIAGLMAVIGYSLNDSIVISDRLRDILCSREPPGIHECTDRAVVATFSRTLITSGTTLFTVGALLLFGGEALFGFALTLFVGVLVGTWSSIVIATPIQELLGLTPAAYQDKKLATAS